MEIILFAARAVTVLTMFVIYGWMTERADRAAARGIVRAWGINDQYLEEDTGAHRR